MSRHLPLGPRLRAAALCALALAPSASCRHPSPSPSAVVPAPAPDQFRNVKVERAEDLLEGRFPGVRVLRGPTGGVWIRIRGTGALTDGREPLYIIDGTPVEVTPGRGLDFLAPADIARIDVLRNAAETTMYGARGGNGVIIITTKRR